MADLQLASMLQSILELLQHNAGTPFVVDQVAERLECSPVLAATALETLAAAGKIERLQQLDGPVTYVVTTTL